jgi:hypothetical protein
LDVWRSAGTEQDGTEFAPPSIRFLKTSEISEIYVSATSPDRTDAAL